MFQDNIKNVERAKSYALAVRESHKVPVDGQADEIFMKLPDFCDHNRIKNAQRVFRCNYFAMMSSMYCGLLANLAIPSILDVLAHTKKSSSDMTAYKRYMQTIYHTLTWLRNDLKPGTKAWKSLESVQKLAFSASRFARNASVGMISQKDMVITQYGFIGFTVLSQKETGVQANRQEMDDYCHLWRVLGHVLGIRDEFNMCCETLDETLERLEVVRKDFLLPNLRNPPEEFASMARYIVNGLSCFDPFDTYNEMIFMVKRLSGVENFHYLQEEMPENYERKNLELLKLSYCDRIVIFLSVMSRQYLTRCFVFRWFFNFMACIGEFFVRYFPIIAFFKFGFRRSYVGIS